MLFGIGAVVAGSAFGALVIGSLSAANRLASAETRAQVISTYFVFAYSGLSIPVVGVGVASDYVGNFRAVLGCSVLLAVLCVLSAAGIWAAAAPPSRRGEREGGEEAGAEDRHWPACRWAGRRFRGVDCDCLEVGRDSQLVQLADQRGSQFSADQRARTATPVTAPISRLVFVADAAMPERSAATVRAQDVTGTTGKVQAPDSQRAPDLSGRRYQFGIDYSHLSADPYSGKRTGGWVCAPGTPVAVWR